MNWKKHSILIFVALIITIPVTVFGIVAFYQSNFQELPVFGKKDHHLADFKMINQHGNEVSLDTWRNKIIVVNFFFTHCPVVCPKMTRNLKTVEEKFIDDNYFEINSFSVDPERDSVPRLAFYASKFHTGPNWNFLTGPKSEIYRLARNSFLVSATDGDGGPNDFIHSDRLVLIDKKGRIRGFYDGTNEKEVWQLVRDIGKLKSEDKAD